jgi:hypothetical protein
MLPEHPFSNQEVSMARRILTALVVGLIVVGGGAEAGAHHSFAAAYDTSKTFTVKGTIKSVRLTNPHSWFFLDVKDEATGQVTEWAFEAGTPSGMIRNGYKANELKAGTPVTIQGRPAKDPTQKAGMLVTLTTAEGKVYAMFGPQENASR